jgi:hypothetical protein
MLVEKSPDIALVDLNLLDHETGAILGAGLSQQFEIDVVFTTPIRGRLATAYLAP